MGCVRWVLLAIGSIRAMRAAQVFRGAVLALLLAPATVVAQDNPESVRAKQDVLWGRMEAAVRDVVHDSDAVVGVAILDLTDQRAFHLNADALYPTASTIKIAVLGELYRQNERAGAGGSGVKLDDLYTVKPSDIVGGEGVLGIMTPGITRLTNRDLAAMMVSLSDNSATNVLIDRVGMDNVNKWLAGLGLEETRLRRHMLDVTAAREGRENTATPRELVTLLKAVHDGRALGKETTDSFLTMLSAQKAGYLTRFLPAEVKVANKPGNLDAVRNDAGIVYAPGRPFAIAVMVTFSKDDLEAETTIARIGQAAWSYFERVGKSSSLGRIVR